VPITRSLPEQLHVTDMNRSLTLPLSSFAFVGMMNLAENVVATKQEATILSPAGAALIASDATALMEPLVALDAIDFLEFNHQLQAAGSVSMRMMKGKLPDQEWDF
jgi:hypothetical protein